MNDENRYSIPEERRIELGNYIKKARLNHTPNKLGLYDLAELTDSSTSLISKIENGKIQKINPFLLQDIAKVLEIDYRVLYRIVGFLNEENSSIVEDTESKKSIVTIWKKNKKEVIDISSISKKGIEELKKYIKYLKIDFNGYEEFLQWKKRKKENIRYKNF